MVIKVSTADLSSTSPCSACFRRLLPSKTNGLVTTATVRQPSPLAMSAIIGAAPVPVPPPIPAVTNTMSAPSSASAISSFDSRAASRPISGLAPAPSPLVRVAPIWILVWARLAASAWMSVLAAMKSTRSRLATIIVLIALHPPPPTPTTRILAACLLSSIVFMGPFTSNDQLICAVSKFSDPWLSRRVRLKNLLQPFLHPALDFSIDVLIADAKESPVLVPGAVDDQPDSGGVHRALHHVDQSPDTPRHPPPDRESEHLFGQLGHSR